MFKNLLRFEISAAELIDLAGLKGYELGGAIVPGVHANFFINYNGSTSSEMLALINFVKERVGFSSLWDRTKRRNQVRTI